MIVPLPVVAENCEPSEIRHFTFHDTATSCKSTKRLCRIVLAISRLEPSGKRLISFAHAQWIPSIEVLPDEGKDGNEAEDDEAEDEWYDLIERCWNGSR